MIARLLLTLATLLLLATGSSPAADGDGLRSERVGWARLKTPSNYWMRHSTGDPTLMQFFRNETTLNIDPIWHVADVEKLDEMKAYPFLFSQGIGVLTTAHSKANLAEYLRRGGFLLIDSCINTDITPDPDIFLLQQKRLLAEILPESRITEIPSDHPLYRCFFPFPEGKPPHTYMANVYNEAWARHGLYAVKVGRRMVGVISLSGLQCGWDRMVAPAGHDIACMKMLVNIYIYAMTQDE